MVVLLLLLGCIIVVIAVKTQRKCTARRKRGCLTCCCIAGEVAGLGYSRLFKTRGDNKRMWRSTGSGGVYSKRGSSVARARQVQLPGNSAVLTVREGPLPGWRVRSCHRWRSHNYLAHVIIVAILLIIGLFPESCKRTSSNT